MAKTGINIQVSNTTFAGVPKVNENSILFYGDEEDRGVDVAVRSVSDFEAKTGIKSDSTEVWKKNLHKQVSGYYNPTTTISNNGKLLWVKTFGVVDNFDPIPKSDFIATVEDAVMRTVENGFESRPRQILMVIPYPVWEQISPGFSPAEALQTAISNLYAEGVATVGIIGGALYPVVIDSDTGDIDRVADVSAYGCPQVAFVGVSDNAEAGAEPIVGRVGGYVINKSVGTSIGDASAEPFDTKLYVLAIDTGFGDVVEALDCASLAKEVIEELGSKQWLFTRTRPPRNGLWWNDGATCADPATALSTLEAGRTIASITDDLREFFTYYINTRVPVADNGDIDPTYKQVVIDAAMSKVIQPYINSGDISNARIELKALNDNMVESRTWEVKLSILPAPTLRWIDAYVFYVKTLE